MNAPPFGKSVPTLGTKTLSPSTIMPKLSEAAVGSGFALVRVDQIIFPESGSRPNVVPSFRPAIKTSLPVLPCTRTGDVDKSTSGPGFFRLGNPATTVSWGPFDRGTPRSSSYHPPGSGCATSPRLMRDRWRKRRRCFRRRAPQSRP
jgi:hypothetical protein